MSLAYCIIGAMPASLPSVQTFVAMNIASRGAPAAMILPMTASERLYIGDVSITLPPASSNRSTISRRAASCDGVLSTSNTL
jgi:hypothetical protein